MKVIYSAHYNIDLGLLNHVHPFDGMKFRTIYDGQRANKNVKFLEPQQAVGMDVVDEFLSSVMQLRVRQRIGVLRALEVPRIPFVSFSFLDRKVLAPMRWGVAGTILGAESALKHGGVFWNLSGGYHHAMPQNMEGFCIYNDVGIAYQQLIKGGQLAAGDKILIIDTDAHHGNGNAATFMDNRQVTILDVYNANIYPISGFTRERVDISVALPPGTDGVIYLQRYSEALERLEGDYRMAFVVAGTDTLMSDRLGGFRLSIDDVAEREKLTLLALKRRSIPSVILGGGGYSKESAVSVIRAISECAQLDRLQPDTAGEVQ